MNYMPHTASETQTEKAIMLLSLNALHADTLSRYLKQHMNCPIAIISQTTLNEVLTQQSGLVLIDLSAFDADDIQDIKIRLRPFNDTHLFALFNAKKISAEELTTWPFIRGVFKENDNLEHLCLGIEKMLSGEYWLPRQKLAELIAHYQKSAQNSDQPELLCLTRREQQILRQLITGASNQEIASGLFISEHTVKSHLYHIFKKINVKNRIQAIFWAKNKLNNVDFQSSY